MTETTRERKVDFINSFTGQRVDRVIEQMTRRMDFFTDDQLALIADRLVRDWRLTQRLNRENRQRAAARSR